MRRAIVAVALGAFACVLAVGDPATAGPTPTQKCEATKLKLVCKKTCCELAIVAKGGSDFSKCTSGFSAGFGKVKGTCGATESALETKVDTFRTDVTNELKPASNKCEAQKIKAVCKKVCCELGADGKAVVKGGTADTTKCKSSFGATFGKLETKGGCATSGDVTTIENNVDAFVDDVVDEVTNETTTTTSTTSSTTSSTVATCANGGIPCNSACGSGGCAGTCYGPQASGCAHVHCGSTQPICMLPNSGATPIACVRDANCPLGQICVAPNPFSCGSGPGSDNFCLNAYCPE